LLPFSSEPFFLLVCCLKRNKCVNNNNNKIKYKILLLVVLNGCETWWMALREEHRVRLFESRVLRRIFGPKRDKITGCWGKLHIEMHHNLYTSPNIIRRIKRRGAHINGACSTHGEKRIAYRILVGRPEGKKLLGRNRHRWDDNIKMDLREIEWSGMGKICLA
jgi:hypothetical protein